MALHPADEFHTVWALLGPHVSAYFYIPYGSEEAVALIVQYKKGQWYSYPPTTLSLSSPLTAPYGGPYRTRKAAAEAH